MFYVLNPYLSVDISSVIVSAIFSSLCYLLVTYDVTLTFALTSPFSCFLSLLNRNMLLWMVESNLTIRVFTLIDDITFPE